MLKIKYYLKLFLVYLKYDVYKYLKSVVYNKLNNYIFYIFIDAKSYYL